MKCVNCGKKYEFDVVREYPIALAETVQIKWCCKNPQTNPALRGKRYLDCPEMFQLHDSWLINRSF